MYLTKIEPSCSKEAIIRYIYDGRSEPFINQKLEEGKADVAIELLAPAEEVRKCGEEGNVYVYPDDINLNETRFERYRMIVVE